MIRQIILLLILNLCFQNCLFAEEKASAQDRIIGSTFKTLAKAFVATVDINKLKKNNIDKLNKMDEGKFKKHYVKVYGVIKDLPDNLKARYLVAEDFTKEEAIKDIKSLDKKKLYEIIDSIPDTIIAQQFRQYLAKQADRIQKSNLAQQINKLWNKIIGRANTPATR